MTKTSTPNSQLHRRKLMPTSTKSAPMPGSAAFREAWNEADVVIRCALEDNDTLKETFLLPWLRRTMITYLKARRDPAVRRAAAQQFSDRLDRFGKAILDDSIDRDTQQMSEPVSDALDQEDRDATAQSLARIQLVRDWAYGGPSQRRRPARGQSGRK